MSERGDRQEVVTYMLRDRGGFIRGRGIPSLEVARGRAASLCEMPGTAPVVVSRVTYVSYTHTEDVEKVDD